MPEQLDISRLHDPRALMNSSSTSTQDSVSFKDICQWSFDERKDIIITSKSDNSRQEKYYSIHISPERILLVDKSDHTKQTLEFTKETGLVTRNGDEDATAEDRLIERLRKVQGDVQRNEAQIFGREVNES